MNKKQKKRIERKLRNYPSKKAQLKNEIIDNTRAPLTAITYDGVFTDTNDFHSIVEDVVCDLDDLPEQTRELMIELNKIYNCLNALPDKEHDMIIDRYWEGKTYEEMADGTYDTWRTATIFKWIEEILNKLKKSGILQV